MPKPGQRVSEFILEEPLGSGAFGEVWRARHHAWHDRVVAVKLPNDGAVVRQLQREGGLVQGLDHPNVVRAIGFDGFADPPYLVSEYVEGGSLRPLIEKRELTPKRSVEIMRQVLSGLGYAHERGLVHRDLKPENILIARDANDGVVAKIADFGLGQKTAAAAVSVVYSLSLDGPAAQQVAGTIDYMAPEQRSGGTVDGRADLYAAAVVLFEMLTGQRPAGHETPGDLNPDVPPFLNDVFRGGYCRVEKRYANAAAFAAALGGPPSLPAKSAKTTTVTPPKLAMTLRSGPRACPRCRREVGEHDQFCMHCSVQLTPDVRRCGNCGSYPDAHDEFCIRCGRPVAGARAPLNTRA